MLIASLIRWGSWALFQELLRELKLVADRHGTTIANIAVCWVLRQLGPLVCMQVLTTAPSPLPTGAAPAGASGRLGGARSTRYDSSGAPRRAPLIACECLSACEHLLDWASVVLIWQEEHKKLAKLIVNGANPISDEDEARIRKVLIASLIASLSAC